MHRIPAQRPEGLLTARESENLHVVGHQINGVEELLYPVVVGLDERIIKHDRHVPPLRGHHPGEAQPGEYRDLLLSPS